MLSGAGCVSIRETCNFGSHRQGPEPTAPLTSPPSPPATPAGTPQNASPKIRAVLGTMSIPDPLDVEPAREALEYFLAAGFDQIDTAILYQAGATEASLGKRPGIVGLRWGWPVYEFLTPQAACIIGVKVFF